MTTTISYANITKLNIKEDDTDDNENESIEPETIPQRDPKEILKLDYLDENDLKLYDFINDLKNYWQDRGFMNTLKHENIVKLLRETMLVTEIIFEDDDYEEEEDENDFYE